MSQSIFEALKKLDPSDDEHWTSDGMPRIEAVEKVFGENLSRKQINDAAPGFNRETHVGSPNSPAQQQAAAAANDGELTEDDFVREISQIEKKMGELEGDITTLEKEKSKLSATLERVQARKQKAFPPQTAANMIQAFQQSQQKQLEESHDEAKRVRQLLGNKAKAVGGNPADKG